MGHANFAAIAVKHSEDSESMTPAKKHIHQAKQPPKAFTNKVTVIFSKS